MVDLTFDFVFKQKQNFVTRWVFALFALYLRYRSWMEVKVNASDIFVCLGEARTAEHATLTSNTLFT